MPTAQLAFATVGILGTTNGTPDHGRLSVEPEASLMDQLLAEVAAAREADKLRNLRRRRVDELLIAVRREYGDSVGPSELEAVMDRFYDRATISRKTSRALGTNRKAAIAA